MSIFKRGNVYWFHFVFDGRHYQQSTKQRNRNVARQIEAAYRTALAKGEVGITERKKVPGFKEAMADYLAWSKQVHRLHRRTFERTRDSSVALLKFFNDTQLDKITTEGVEHFKTRRSAECRTVYCGNGNRKRTSKPIRPATVNRELACLREMFNHAIKGNELIRNPIAKGRVKFLAEDNEQTRVLSYDEQVRHMAAASERLRPIATVVVETGMRPGEVYRIQSDNVHLDRGELFNPFGKTKAAKRTIKLTAAARAVLEYRLAIVGSGYLFPNENDSSKPASDVVHLHQAAVKASGIAPCRLYDLRHTFATRAAQSGMDLLTLAKTLGHSKIQMVMRYVHPMEQHEAEAIERLERYNAEQRIAQAPAVSDAVQ